MKRKSIQAQELAARAKANGYVPGAHHEKDSVRNVQKYAPKTLHDQNGALQRYHMWLEEYPQPEDLTLRKGLQPLGLSTLRDFFRFYAMSSKGLLEKRVTVDTLLACAEWFFAGFARVTENQFSEDDRTSTYKWIKAVLPAEGLLVNKRRPKHLFTEDDMVNFNTTFWTVDDSTFVHPRNRAQIPFLISVYCWTGARIGAFFSAAGLRYRDLEMVLLGDSSRWKVIYRIDQRWIKNNKDPENIAFGASTSQHCKLLYDDTQYLLALAIADQAIHGVDDIDALWELQIPPGQKELILRWNDEVSDLSIIRKATKAHGVTKSPLPQRTFACIVKSIFKLSGYYGNPTVHSIRRGLGKKVDERYSDVQRSQHLTQSDKRVFGQSYVGNTSSVDGRSAFLSETAQHDHVNFFQSYAKLREPGLITKLPAAKAVAIWRNPELLDLEKRLKQLQDTNATAAEIKVAQRSVSRLYHQLSSQILVQCQQEWVQDRRDWKVQTRGKESPNDFEQKDLSEVLHKLMPEYGRLAKMMISPAVVSQEERKQAIRDLSVLVARDCETLYRPGEEPINGFCPVEDCQTDMKSLKGPYRNTHIHSCRHKQLAKILKRPQCELQYCFTCFEWFAEEHWDKHCQAHLDTIKSPYCATYTYCHTLLRPGLCPFCLGDERPTTPATGKWKTWVRDRQLREHIQIHLVKIRWPLACPHPLCTSEFANETLFLFHLQDVHGLKMSKDQQKGLSEGILQTQRASQKRKSDCEHVQPSHPTKIARVESHRNQEKQSPNTDGIVSQTLCPCHIDELYKPPSLVHSEASSPSESDNLSVIGHMDELFTSYLTPLSPSSLPAKEINQDNYRNTDSDTKQRKEIGPAAASGTVPSNKIIEMPPSELVDESSVFARPRTTRPRITLRLRQPKSDIETPDEREAHTTPQRNSAIKRRSQRKQNHSPAGHQKAQSKHPRLRLRLSQPDPRRT